MLGDIHEKPAGRVIEDNLLPTFPFNPVGTVYVGVLPLTVTFILCVHGIPKVLVKLIVKYVWPTLNPFLSSIYLMV